MSVNMSCVEATGVSGTTNGAGQFAMAARNPGAIWLSLQHQVTPHTFMRRKLLNVIDEAVRRVQAGGKKCNARLAVETVNASTSKTSAAPNQFMSVLKFAAHSADSTPDDGLIQKGRAFSSGDDSFIKVLGIFKDLPLDPAALAKLLLIFFLSTQMLEEILEEDSSEDAILHLLPSCIAPSTSTCTRMSFFFVPRRRPSCSFATGAPFFIIPIALNPLIPIPACCEGNDRPHYSKTAFKMVWSFLSNFGYIF
ncbi:hypothetical protein M758_UG194700 [Ceratodon purpureus]|nr:hypothetical protein M758_UG194700 [Ceratodon purpureus]KAG0595760.1 hypothetical protein M758_UG194700 [Ceratodon purpureus]